MTRFHIRRRLGSAATSVVTTIVVAGKRMLCKIRGDGKTTQMECTPLEKGSPLEVADRLPHRKKGKKARKGRKR